nr:2834_t:CDS:2 [Entrophospora candida]
MTWNDTHEVLALASIIVLTWPCPYNMFTSSEWKQIIDTNPYKMKELILAPISTLLYYACSQIAIGLDYTLESNGDSEFDKKAYRIFNILKDELPLVPKPKMTEDEHCCFYLHPLLKPFFCCSFKNYEVRLNKSVDNSLKRPDFSCRIDNITILNSEIKPSGYTPFQKNKDFVKINTQAKHSINQLLSKKGGPNYTMFLSNMDISLVGDKIDSFFMTLNHDGIYQAWPWLNTKLVMDRSSFPLMVLCMPHFSKLEGNYYQARCEDEDS